MQKRFNHSSMVITTFRLMLAGLLLFINTTEAAQWLKVAPGIEYQDLNTGTIAYWSHVHVFKIDLNQNAFELVLASTLLHKQARVSEFAEHSKALIAINGGFFDQQYHPLGLRISHQRQHNPLKNISWWGIFYIKNQKAHISSIRNFKQDAEIDFAIQTGPRLLIHGNIPSLKPGLAERSALGITKDGQIIIIVTEHCPLSTTWLAEQMKASPLDCTDALNLDGGSSSQLYANLDSLDINTASLASVSDAIVVKPR